MEKSYRGKCESKSKVTKDGKPKRSGNFSYITFHAQSLQSKDYDVFRIIKDDGIENLVVGETPLAAIFGEFGALVETLAMRDDNFKEYRREGVHSHCGKQYECRMTLKKIVDSNRYWKGNNRLFKLRIEIYTDGEFTYNFPEY